MLAMLNIKHTANTIVSANVRSGMPSYEVFPVVRGSVSRSRRCSAGMRR